MIIHTLKLLILYLITVLCSFCCPVVLYSVNVSLNSPISCLLYYFIALSILLFFKKYFYHQFQKRKCLCIHLIIISVDYHYTVSLSFVRFFPFEMAQASDSWESFLVGEDEGSALTGMETSNSVKSNRSNSEYDLLNHAADIRYITYFMIY